MTNDKIAAIRHKKGALMFDNIDSKIKGLAVLYTIAGIIGSIAGASYYFIHGVALIGFLILIFGILASWIGSFMLYGFGELISKTTKIEENIKKLQSLTPSQNSNQNDKNNDIPGKEETPNADYIDL